MAQAAGHAQMDDQRGAVVQLDQQVFGARATLAHAAASQALGQLGVDWPAQARLAQHRAGEGAAGEQGGDAAPGGFHFWRNSGMFKRPWLKVGRVILTRHRAAQRQCLSAQPAWMRPCPSRASLNGQPHAKSFMNILYRHGRAAGIRAVGLRHHLGAGPRGPGAGPPRREAAYPKLALSNDILFGVLASEIAAQRGAAAASAPTVLALAQRTCDHAGAPAAEFALTANRLTRPSARSSSGKSWSPPGQCPIPLIAALLRAGWLSEATPGVQAQLAARPHEAPQVFMHHWTVVAATDKAGAYAMM